MDLRDSPLGCISASLAGGGAERQIAMLANHLAAKACPVTLFTYNDVLKKDFYYLSPRVIRRRLGIIRKNGLFSSLKFCVFAIRELRAAICCIKPKVIISFITATNVFTLLASLGLDVRVIVSDRVHPAVDATVPFPFRILRRLLYRFAYLVVVQTRAAAVWTSEKTGARVAIIPNALRDLPMPTFQRESLLLAVGRLAHQKGFDVLLEAFALIAEQHPQWRLVIIGEGPERKKLSKMCELLGLQKRVLLAGFTSEVESWLGRSAIFVMPSRFEGFPNSLLEAMGMGNAVISSNCLSGPAELIREGQNGLLVPVGDVKALASALVRLIKNPQLRKQLGTAALAVRKAYNQKHIMKIWDNVLFNNQAIAKAEISHK